MDALTIDRELAGIAQQTRRLAVWSSVVHVAGAVLLLAVASQPTLDAATDEVLTEITWSQPETGSEEAVASIAAAAVDDPPSVTTFEPAASAPPVTLPAAAPRPQARSRESGPLPVAQRPGDRRAGDASHRVVALAGAAPGPRASWSSVSPRTATPTRELNRTAAAPVAKVAALPRARQGVLSAASTSPAEPRPETAVFATREIQPGVQLAGEVSGRRLREHAVPAYPEWAQRDGVEVSVKLYFTVLADGRVKENVLVERTSGFDDFDRLARAALASWRFESLGPGATAEQWGRVEFKYRLRSLG